MRGRDVPGFLESTNLDAALDQNGKQSTEDDEHLERVRPQDRLDSALEEAENNDCINFRLIEAEITMTAVISAWERLKSMIALMSVTFEEEEKQWLFFIQMHGRLFTYIDIIVDH